MREDVDIFPAGEVQRGTMGKISEAGRRQLGATFAREHGIQLFPQGMQIENVGRGIGKLRLAHDVSTPI